MRVVRGRLVEGRIGRAEGAEDFVGRDVQEAELVLGGAFEGAPMAQGGLQELESAGDVRSPGPSMERSTWDSAARCITASGCAAAKARRMASASQISACMKVKPGWPCRSAKEDRFPA